VRLAPSFVKKKGVLKVATSKQRDNWRNQALALKTPANVNERYRDFSPAWMLCCRFSR